MNSQRYQSPGIGHFIQEEAARMNLSDNATNHRPVAMASQSPVLKAITSHITQAMQATTDESREDLLAHCRHHIASLSLTLGAAMAMIDDAYDGMNLAPPMWNSTELLTGPRPVTGKASEKPLKRKSDGSLSRLAAESSTDG